MKLYTTTRSPYARKVYMMALEKGLKGRIELEVEDLKNKSSALVKNNPLGQIPLLLLDNGEAVFDSVVVADYLDDLNDSPKLIPSFQPQKMRVMRTASLGDGMMDNAVAIFYENLKGSAKDDAKIKKSGETLEKCFKYLEKEIAAFGKTIDMGQIAVFCALGYINFRLKDIGWEKKHSKLAAWFAEFSKRPSAVETMPRD